MLMSRCKKENNKRKWYSLYNIKWLRPCSNVNPIPEAFQSTILHNSFRFLLLSIIRTSFILLAGLCIMINACRRRRTPIVDTSHRLSLLPLLQQKAPHLSIEPCNTPSHSMGQLPNALVLHPSNPFDRDALTKL